MGNACTECCVSVMRTFRSAQLHRSSLSGHLCGGTRRSRSARRVLHAQLLLYALLDGGALHCSLGAYAGHIGKRQRPGDHAGSSPIINSGVSQLPRPVQSPIATAIPVLLAACMRTKHVELSCGGPTKPSWQLLRRTFAWMGNVRARITSWPAAEDPGTAACTKPTQHCGQPPVLLNRPKLQAAAGQRRRTKHGSAVDRSQLRF